MNKIKHHPDVFQTELIMPGSLKAIKLKSIICMIARCTQQDDHSGHYQLTAAKKLRQYESFAAISPSIVISWRFKRVNSNMAWLVQLSKQKG